MALLVRRKTIESNMIETLAISLWSHLFCGPWSESGKVFGWLKLAAERLPYFVRHPFIECGACHAVWVSVAYQVATYCGCFDVTNILQILSASFGAILLEDFKDIREKWKHS
jgi:hypothetical protein